MLDFDHDRRQAPRISLTRPCKVLEPRSRRYIGGTTCNVGAAGMLIRLDRRVALEVGDRLYVAIAREPRQGLLRSREMVETCVVRALPMTSGETAVALRFSDPHGDLNLPLPAAA